MDLVIQVEFPSRLTPKANSTIVIQLGILVAFLSHAVINAIAVVRPGPQPSIPAKVNRLKTCAFEPSTCPKAASKLSIPVAIKVQKIARSRIPEVNAGARHKQANPKKKPQARNSNASITDGQ